MAANPRRAIQPRAAQSASYDDPDMAEIARRTRELEKAKNPLDYGVKLVVSFPTVGGQTVRHKLGRPVVGWMLTRLRNDFSTTPPTVVNIMETSSDDQTITFYCGVTGTVANITVF